jgi:hypothetical protein
MENNENAVPLHDNLGENYRDTMEDRGIEYHGKQGEGWARLALWRERSGG